MKKSTKTLLLVLALVLVVGAIGAAWLIFSPGSSAGGKTITVNVAHTDGTVNSCTVKTDAEFLAPALEAKGLISGEMADYGLFIDTVDGEFADSAKGQWWVFTVNGEMGNYGADTQPIADGDVYDFSIYEG